MLLTSVTTQKKHVEGEVDKAVATGNPIFLSLTVFLQLSERVLK